MAEREEDGSEKLIPKDAYWQIKYKLRIIEEWRRESEQDRKDLHKRMREIEDYNLEQRTRLRDFIRWMAVLATCITTAVNILTRILFK